MCDAATVVLTNRFKLSSFLTIIGTSDEVRTAGGSAVQQTAPASDVDMNEAMKMTKLFPAGSQTQQ